MSAKDYKKEILNMLDEINDTKILKLIYGLTKSGYREEQAVKRIENMERRGVAE